MGKLQILSPQLANMIAAGEVVQRPASVVKELLENAIDAGASDIQLIVKDAGRTLIQIIDNGCGMSKEDAQLCFARHATSKIAEPEDLGKLNTYGFRGEALASIAAISQVTLKTKKEEDEVGSQVLIEGGEIKETGSISHPVGTSIEVRNLFFNTPARRKFLKSDNVELKHIIEELTRAALGKPELAFKLRHNDKDVLVLKKAQSIKYRILDILGSSVVGDVVDLNSHTNIVNISGYIGQPQGAKKTLGNQYLFVNGRFFKSPYLHKAIMNAYSELMPEGLTPSYFIFLYVDPQSVDVNISPTKTEVKFENDSIIFQTLYASVRETLGRNGFGEMIDFEAASALNLSSFSANSNAQIKPSELDAALGFESSYNPFDNGSSSYGSGTDGQFSSPYYNNEQSFDGNDGGVLDSHMHEGQMFGGQAQQFGRYQTKDNYSNLFDGSTAEVPKTEQNHFVVGKKYICTPVENGLMLTNIYRAEVRILYEQMLKSLEGQTLVGQSALFPIQIQIGPAYIPLIEEHLGLLESLGFTINIISNDSIIVSAIPMAYDFDEMSVRNTMADLLQILQEEHNTLSHNLQQNVAKRLSEVGVSKNSKIQTSQQAQILLDQLFECANSDTTPSGKRISKFVSVEDLEKLF